MIHVKLLDFGFFILLSCCANAGEEKMATYRLYTKVEVSMVNEQRSREVYKCHSNRNRDV